MGVSARSTAQIHTMKRTRFHERSSVRTNTTFGRSGARATARSCPPGRPSTPSSTAAAKQAAITQIEQALDRLLGTGNQQFRGRYLFAGSKTSDVPFEDVGGLANLPSILSVEGLDALIVGPN